MQYFCFIELHNINYSYYILGKQPTIFFPQMDIIENFLTSIGVSSEMYNLNSSKVIKVNDEELGEFNIKFIEVKHVSTIPSYGFLMMHNNKEFYYSGDSNEISNEIINMLLNGDIYRIYQETCGLDYKGNNHLSMRELCEVIPKEFRSKVFCMHIDKHITQEEIEANGFNICTISRINKLLVE